MAPEKSNYGVHTVVESLTEDLRAYIEAQYHIKNESLIQERRALLEKPEVISQLPYVESTPVYELGPAIENLNIPTPALKALSALSTLGVGVFPRPYIHQVNALEQFLNHDKDQSKDLIIATGTGSGKTESFLMPIIGQLAIEADAFQETANTTGCRAILLYPMNALVNDQLSRIRILFGGIEASKIISNGRGRPITFGSYTGRTPYPGPRTSGGDTRHIEPLFDNYYLPILANDKKVRELEGIGQWPAKDLAGFYANIHEEIKQTKRGSRRYRNWKKRLNTQLSDRELMTRHEMHQSCPDILITNYSMLEYMLMRPIERPIFTQTKNWLHSNDENYLILVLDEAHMYRGAGGAEVALLLRRLAARLEIPREKLRCILTSASLGEGEEASNSVRQFAHDLTGLRTDSPLQFSLITGEKESLIDPRPGTKDEADIFASFDLIAFQNFATKAEKARATITNLAPKMGWPLPEKADLSGYLYENLSGLGPVEYLIGKVSGRALRLEVLEKDLFPDCINADRATASLLALTTFAKRTSDGRVLLPTRLHMFFRGLPGLHACCNPLCKHRESGLETDTPLGKFFTRSLDSCDCEEVARVYELYTHRECGSAFLRGYLDSPDGNFLWHEPSGALREGAVTPLIETELLVESSPHKRMRDQCVEIWLDIHTGLISRNKPSDMTGFRHAFMPAPGTDLNAEHLKFINCPICCSKTLWDGGSNIMDHITKGEAPFANLIKTQLFSQPAAKSENRDFPNGGRKVLIFSDGRQKAARLARDIPREVEDDIFRQVICLATQRLEKVGKEPRPTRNLYTAFLTVVQDFNLPLFDRDDAKKLKQEIERLDKDFDDADFEDILEDFEAGEILGRYHIALMKQLCGRYYSIVGSSVGFLGPTKRAFKSIKSAIAELVTSISNDDAESLIIAWILGLTAEFAFNRDLNSNIRARSAGYWRASWGSNGQFPKQLRSVLHEVLSCDAGVVPEIENSLRNEFSLADESQAYFLDQNKLRLKIDLTSDWYQCDDCTVLAPVTINSRCISCGSNSVQVLDPKDSEYIRARKGFWRDPVERALGVDPRLRTISVEEHTAQLSNRDTGRIRATTEEYELRFRDLSDKDQPIDVLSCTTTMEVGVDIGSLVAVGLRNVPPQRANYQQRAGRAGRRGASVSTVITYAQNGPHDSYYFFNPQEIVAGDPRSPEVKIDNPKIARRHIHSFLFQTFFHEYMDENDIAVGGETSALSRALGRTPHFFYGTGFKNLDLKSFENWIKKQIIEKDGDLRAIITSWLPPNLRIEPVPTEEWIAEVAKELIVVLEELKTLVLNDDITDSKDNGTEEDEKNLLQKTPEHDELLEFLFQHGLLPSYAFPTDLTSFLVDALKQSKKTGKWDYVVVERPQQAIEKALSEYAPGRLVVIDKETYRCGGVFADTFPTEHNRAEPLFAGVRQLVHCETCNFVQDLEQEEILDEACPVCGSDMHQQEMIVPEAFGPMDARPVREGDRDQEITYATMAQFPVPIGHDDLPSLEPISNHASFTVVNDRRLVTVNKGRSVGEEYGGFWVCEKCGHATTEEQPTGSHSRPYRIEFDFSKPRPSRNCNGEFRNVFLGHTFTTDLLLLRLTIETPFITNTENIISLRTLEDSLYSLAEAIRLAASRHRQLDLDPSEFGAGFRIVPGSGSDDLNLDIYLYDTLSGGAGYAELAGNYLSEILDSAITLLEGCVGACDHSCQDCLRHFYNQHLQDRLDRHLGAQLLQFCLSDSVPETKDSEDQANQLSRLQRLLELEEITCERLSEIDGVKVPLLAEKGGRKVAIGTRSPLLDKNEIEHPLYKLDHLPDINVRVINSYLLNRNLPDVHQEIRHLIL